MTGSAPQHPRSRAGRRELALAVLVCAAAAGLVLVAAGREWLVELVDRPAPLTPQRITHTGGDLRPWLPALGWLGVAGAGALLATRALARRLVGGLLALAGIGIMAGAGSAAAAGATRGGWALLATIGGLAVTVAGLAAMLRSSAWPALGARYERTGAPTSRPETPGSGGSTTTPESLWEALDRGEDPTEEPPEAPEGRANRG